MRVLAAVAALFALALFAQPAAALPSFAQQTGEPCSKCHVGAYGPQLKQYGRDFKLFGYWAGDDKNTLPPVAVVLQESFTHTRADRAPIPGHHSNDNLTYTSAILAYAGRIAGGVGTFSEVFYDGVRHKYSVGRIDVRRAFTSDVGGHDIVWGVSANNRPGLADLWNSTPVFEFSILTSSFAPSPAAAPAIDGKLSGRVFGASAYAMWDETLYTELAAYAPLTRDVLIHEGLTATPTTDRITGTSPYWRVALQHEFHDTHYAEVGAYGLSAERFPGGVMRAGTDRLTDWGVDATYQYIGGGRSYLAAHATLIHEDANLGASAALTGVHPRDRLNVARADLIYSFADTWTPAVEVFRTTGSTDPRFFKTSTGDPGTDGYVLELAYAPFGKKGSPMARFGNVKLNARWIGYTRFNGRTQGASANDTFFVGANLAVAPFGAFVR